jgi:hypothetical protein
MKKIAIITPTYNDVHRLKVILPKIKHWLINTKINYEVEIFIINDGGSEVDLIKHVKKYNFNYLNKKNTGLMDTLIYGMKNIDADFYLTITSDMPVHINNLDNFVNYINDYDIVQGSRILKNLNNKTYTKGRPKLRSFITYCLYLLNKCIYCTNIKDSQIDFKIFNKKIIDEILPKLKLKHDGMKMTEILIRTYSCGLKIKELGVNYIEEMESIQYPDSKLISINVFNTIFRAFIAYLNLFFILRNDYKNNKLLKNPFNFNL